MSTNPYFNHFAANNEQTLWEDLIVESIQIYGIDVRYIPRTLNNIDEIFGQDDLASYENAYPVEMYVESVFGFSGDKTFISKFAGVEIRDQVKFVVARRAFNTHVGTATSFVRPREGDLVYFPLNRKCFEIKAVEDKPYFYPLGALQTFRLECELYEYSSEQFNTGNTAVDRTETLSLDPATWAANTDIGDIDKNADNDVFQEEANTILQWNPVDPFSEGNI